MEPTFFAKPAAWRRWLERHHAGRREILVGFYKKDSGQPSMTWPESVDAALCFGWSDGVRRRIDDASYSIRFTPRKPRSIWSDVNIRRVAELSAAGLMHAAGVKAFEAREEKRSRVYSFEQKSIEFESAQADRFQENAAAWKFFQSQALSWRRAVTWWVISAKREETKAKRLATLIRESEQNRTVAQFTRYLKAPGRAGPGKAPLS